MATKYPTVNQIKRHDFGGLPAHWVSDWLLQVLQKPASFLITDGDYQLSTSEQSDFDAGISQMQAGTPLAYLIGKQAFWSLEFEVNEHTLIPRPDTEVLVEQVLNWIKINHQDLPHNSDTQPKQLLDLGTGSGCIALSLAHELDNIYPKQWQVTAIDYSKLALEVAQRNAQRNQVSNIDFTQSDWFSAIKPDCKFDVIVSNPPYIVENDKHLTKLKAEPLSALVATDNGLADIRQIAEQARQYLAIGGLLAVEHGFDQGEAVREIFTTNAYDQVHTVQDYGGNDRVTLGVYRG
ncbi:peptide chain release factor N(5)-glutamine methyltransferase [Psychrobacter lutiphocae]|uniref:peptide chain release factor N(5)-glutamine methyltransferase n=1 Tax=Psychrobacter lutiphocae TaxID=540500 RepID=UPI00037679FD|nr:peptide chain release factor N(5)-glutamine methyltransferase [Psychrobacter lutiphocae]